MYPDSWNYNVWGDGTQKSDWKKFSIFSVWILPLENYFWVAGRTHLKRFQSLPLPQQRAKPSFQEAHTCPTSGFLFKGKKLSLYLRARLPIVGFFSGKKLCPEREMLSTFILLPFCTRGFPGPGLWRLCHYSQWVQEQTDSGTGRSDSMPPSPPNLCESVLHFWNLIIWAYSYLDINKNLYFYSCNNYIYYFFKDLVDS